jgi:iron(III) transport system substrate-binding protein
LLVTRALSKRIEARRILPQDPCFLLFPDGDLGSSMLSAAVSLLDGADNEAEAIAFIEYLLSDAGQEYFTTETFEYPLAGDVEPEPTLPGMDEIELTRIDFSTLGGELHETIEMIEESGL